MTDYSAIDEPWRNHRGYVVNLAYQLLGDIGDAEDIAQEAFLRLSRTAGVDDARAWLTVVATRLCLDQLRSARVRRESPEERAMLDDAMSSEPDPADRVTLDDQVSEALWEVLRRLNPGERVTFVLHDVFGLPFDEIARTVGRPAATCRQLARRARAKLADEPPRLVDINPAAHHAVTEGFISACGAGDIDALMTLLDPSIWGEGRLIGIAAPPQINRGRIDVATNLIRYLGPGTTLVVAAGGTSEAVVLAFRARRVLARVNLDIREGRIVSVRALVDSAVAGDQR
jgi:RNA polymerase sigma-70 factor (ECF subfamily)